MPQDFPGAGPVLINQGTFDNPWQDGRSMTPSPEVHATAILRDTRMWPWSYIGPDCTVVDSEIREFVYAVSDNQIFNADVGKFCNIASGVRINPTIIRPGAPACTISPTAAGRTAWARTMPRSSPGGTRPASYWPNARLAEAMANLRGLDAGAFAAKYDTGG